MAEVVAELCALAQKLEHRPESGLYVTDEHNLTGFLTAFGTGCINPLGGINRGVLVEKLNSSRYKMCLAWNDKALVLRSFLRLVEVEIPGDRGPALWLDPPTNAGRAAATPQETGTLTAGMIAHGLAKAHAMGIPFLSADVGTAAKDKGLAALRVQAKIIMDRGHTGVHHTQKIQGFNAYGISWPESTWSHGKTKPAAGQAVIRLSGAAQVVMPDSGFALANLSVLRQEWEQAADGDSLINVPASVGLLLFDVTTRLGLTQEEQTQVLGDQLFREALVKSQL